MTPENVEVSTSLKQIEDKIFEYQLRVADLNISPSSIVKAMEFKEGYMPQFYTDKVEEVWKETETEAHIRVGYRILPAKTLQLHKDRFNCCNIEFLSGKIIASQLKKSETISLFAGTAGSYFDGWSRQLFEEGDFPTGYVVDLMGSEIVEHAIDWLELKLGDLLAEKQLRMTNRFSPGYCGWNVDEQHKLFTLLPTNFCGIRLTDSALMVPIKSVSGVIGVGREVKRKDYPCAICDMKDCYRKRNYKH